MPGSLFSLGVVMATANALRALEFNEVTPQSLVRRHECGDWGETPSGDRCGNEQCALAGEGCITSTYRLHDGEIVLVVTSLGEESTVISQPGDDQEMALWASQWRGTLHDDVPPVSPQFMVPIAA